MVSPHLLKLRIRRAWRRSLLLVRGTGDSFEKNLLGRLGRLQQVWKFVLGWLAAFALVTTALTVQILALRPLYQVWAPVPGGRFSEGIAGSFTTANPLYAVSDADATVSRLIFAGLLTYDKDNTLVGDMAESWSADPSGKVYTVRLRPNLFWQDGQPVTADDVVYTYKTIQNPDARSPLLSSWQNVTVAAVDDHVVTFTLPNPLSSFPSSLTNGIIPKHILESVNAVDLRSIGFNTAQPVGSGPFRWGSIGVSGIGDKTEAQINLLPFSRYWAGEPKLTNLTVSIFADQDAMIQAYANQQLTAVAGLESIPTSLQKSRSVAYNLPLSAGVFVFFRPDGPALSDSKVRQALTLAVDRATVIKALDYPAQAVDEPLLEGQLGYDPALRQVTGNLAQAKATLDAAGWQVGAHGMRSKNGHDLTFTLSVPDSQEYKAVAYSLRKQWLAAGANVQLIVQQASDFQGNLSQHSYEAVLYGVSIGQDPDVFVYWDSSQNDQRSPTRLNFAEYKSTAADLALEAGRTRLDPLIRAAKYHAFLQAWQQDSPALALYQPRFLYLSHVPVAGLYDHMTINNDADRFRNVQNWMIDHGWVTR